MGEACAALARGLPLPQRIASFGLTAQVLSPQRLFTHPPGANASGPA
jgi:D-arginine dehydrogenase